MDPDPDSLEMLDADPDSMTPDRQLSALCGIFPTFVPVLRIRFRIHTINMFLGHPDPLVRATDPDPSIIKKNSSV